MDLKEKLKSLLENFEIDLKNKTCISESPQYEKFQKYKNKITGLNLVNANDLEHLNELKDCLSLTKLHISIYYSNVQTNFKINIEGIKNLENLVKVSLPGSSDNLFENLKNSIVYDSDKYRKRLLSSEKQDYYEKFLSLEDSVRTLSEFDDSHKDKMDRRLFMVVFNNWCDKNNSDQQFSIDLKSSFCEEYKLFLKKYYDDLDDKPDLSLFYEQTMNLLYDRRSEIIEDFFKSNIVSDSFKDLWLDLISKYQYT